jgi:hypothetical protein
MTVAVYWRLTSIKTGLSFGLIRTTSVFNSLSPALRPAARLPGRCGRQHFLSRQIVEVGMKHLPGRERRRLGVNHL